MGISSDPHGGGYWLVSASGSVAAFGDAPSYGSTAGAHLNAPIVGMASTPDGSGYWEVASDGGVFTFGDAQFYGSLGAQQVIYPIAGIAIDPDGGGYWLLPITFARGSAASDNPRIGLLWLAGLQRLKRHWSACRVPASTGRSLSLGLTAGMASTSVRGSLRPSPQSPVSRCFRLAMTRPSSTPLHREQVRYFRGRYAV